MPCCAGLPSAALPCPPPPLYCTVLQALDHLEYPKRLRRLLLTPEREVAVELALLRDNGEVATFNAYRVQHDNSRGPYKGGLRYHPDVDLDDVRRWALSSIAAGCWVLPGWRVLFRAGTGVRVAAGCWLGGAGAEQRCTCWVLAWPGSSSPGIVMAIPPLRHTCTCQHARFHSPPGPAGRPAPRLPAAVWRL